MSEQELDLSMFSDVDDTFTEENLIEGGITEELDGDGNPINQPVEPKVDEPEPPAEPGATDEPIDEPEIDEPEDGDTKKVKLVYNNVAKLLKEQGLFDEEIDLEKIESSDSLVEALKGEIKRSEFSDLSDTQSEYLKAIREGIPDKMFLEHKRVEASYNNITDEMVGADESLRKNIIMADLTAKGMSVSRAEKFHKTLADSGEDVAEAMSSLGNLKDTEKARYDAAVVENQKVIDNQKAEETNRVKRLKNSVYETKEIIKDFKLTEKLKDKVYETMTKPVAYSEAGVPMNKISSDRDKDPIGFDTRLAYIYTMTKGFSDFSSFKKNASTKAARELERVVLEGGNSLNVGSVPNLTMNDQNDIPQITELSDE